MQYIYIHIHANRVNQYFIRQCPSRGRTFMQVEDLFLLLQQVLQAADEVMLGRFFFPRLSSNMAGVADQTW
jgi:hypothetical protein